MLLLFIVYIGINISDMHVLTILSQVTSSIWNPDMKMFFYFSLIQFQNKIPYAGEHPVNKTVTLSQSQVIKQHYFPGFLLYVPLFSFRNIQLRTLLQLFKSFFCVQKSNHMGDMKQDKSCKCTCIMCITVTKTLWNISLIIFIFGFHIKYCPLIVHLSFSRDLV